MDTQSKRSERSQQQLSSQSMQEKNMKGAKAQADGGVEGGKKEAAEVAESKIARANSNASRVSRVSARSKVSQLSSRHQGSEKTAGQRSRPNDTIEDAERNIQMIFSSLLASTEVQASEPLTRGITDAATRVQQQFQSQRQNHEQQQDQLTKQMNEQQEQFFQRIQEREEQLEELRAKAQETNEVMDEAATQIRNAVKDGADDDGKQEQISYEEEEKYAQQRKLASVKFTKTATKLQALLERNLSEQARLEQRVEGVSLLQELSSIMTTQMQENKNLQLGRIKRESRVKALQENITFLEGRLSDMLTEKEEQAIKLKSEVIIYKQKAKQYKGQMLEQQEKYRSNNEQLLAERVALSKEEFINEMKTLQSNNQALKAEVRRLTDENQELADRNKEFEKQYMEEIDEKKEAIRSLEGELRQIEHKHKRAKSKIQGKKDEAQRKLNIEEKERELYGLKLEQVMINNKKLVLQKKFLEKQLEKDRREIHLEMNKIQIEIQQDQLMNSSSALSRFKGVYQAVSDQLAYVEQIVGFMDFDQEGAPGGGTQIGALSGGAQPPSFEEVAKEINSKFPQGPRPGSEQMVDGDQQQVSGDETQGAARQTSAGPAGQSAHSHSANYDQNQDAGGVVDQSQAPMNMTMNISQNMTPSLAPMVPSPQRRRNTGAGAINNPASLAATRTQSQQQQPRGPMGGGHGGAPQQVLLTIDECLASYPNELLYALLEMLNENFKDAKIHQSEHITRLLELVQGQVDKGVVHEIFDKFLLQNRMQFSQYLYKLNEKQKALEIERKNLQFKVQRVKLDMKRIEQSEQNQLQQKQKKRVDGQEVADDEEPNQQLSEEVADAEVAGRLAQLPADRQSDGGEEWNAGEQAASFDVNQFGDGQAMAGGRAMQHHQGAEHGISSPAVPGNLQRATLVELGQQVDVLKQENVALKERCKEIRLNLQRRITELQDTLTISRQRYLTELSELKVEYGKDLNRITRSSKERSFELQKQFELLKEEEFAELQREFALKEAELKGNIVENEQKAKKAIEEAEINVRDAERDLKKLKKESTGYFKGGWGTFIVTFEVGEAAWVEGGKLGGASGLSLGHAQSGSANGQNSQSLKALSKQGKKKAGSTVSGKSRGSSRNASSTDSHQNLAKLDDLVHPHPIETISHFVEVGFLIDRNNFRLLNTFEEATYDSSLKKYLFELQDPIDNFQMNDLEFKIKQQLTDNVGLFNEINPVYISMNMGRPSTPVFDDYVSQDRFRLIQREGVYLMGDRWLMINFLKCDYLTQAANVENSVQQNVSALTQDTEAKEKTKAPMQYILRVIAFENETSSRFAFDLNFEDLLTLMQGNMKLLEDENTHDLCQILLNNLALIKREKADKKGNTEKGKEYEDVLIVEHKIFFNEQYRAVYDKKNKHIMAKYDKQRQGLVQDVALSTDYEKSVIYEAFTHVYKDQVAIQSTQRPDASEIVGVEILRGKMSGNIRLKVTFVNHGGAVREMSLFAEAQQRSHKVCSEIIHLGNGPMDYAAPNEGQLPPEGANSSSLAFVVSIEKLYGAEDILVVRLVLIEKWDEHAMLDYSWNPDGRPQEGSTQFNSQTIYLVKKSDSLYCQVTEYEILNTEIRTQLFMHSYGYIQANVDFGNVRRYLEQGEIRRVNYLSVLGSEEYMRDALNVNVKAPADIGSFKGLDQLLYRQFCILRLRNQLIPAPNKIRPGQALDRAPLNQAEGEQLPDGLDQQDKAAVSLALPEGKDEDEDSFTNHYALVAIFDDGQCLDRGAVIIKVVIQEEGIDATGEVEILPEVVSAKQLQQIKNEEYKIEVCSTIIDKLVLSEYQQRNDEEFTEASQEERQFLLKMDKDIQPMSEFIAQAKQNRFEEMLRHEEGRHDDDKVEMELKDVVALKIPLTTLAECQKTSQMTLINQKLYKVTAYFVKSQRGFEPKLPQSKRMFDWHFVYIEVAQRSSDHQIVFAVTEKDIVSILQKLRQKMKVEGKDVNRELAFKTMSKEAILNLILDCFLMDAETYEVRLSMLHMHARYVERCALEEKFIETGGRFVSMKDGLDPELAEFKTGVPHTEMTKRLIQNIQKDMSDKTFDVKIYELGLRSLPGAKKIRFEIFWVDAPDVVFRCDMLSSANQDGSQIIMEKINIVEQLEQQQLEKGLVNEEQYDPSKFAKDGLVLAICESCFPHQISFMLIEPCSHIQWEYSYFDEKLNVIETRQQRLNFVSNLREVLVTGILRDIRDSERALRISPGEQQLRGEDQLKDTFYCLCTIDDVLRSSRPSNPYQLVFAHTLEIVPGQFRNLTLVSDSSKGKIILRLAPLDDAGANTALKPDALNLSDIHISLNSQMEGSRVVSGCISPGLDGGTRKNILLYTVEIACALKRKERAIRVSIFDQVAESPIISIAFIDKAIYEDRMEMRPEIEFAIRSGFTDSLAIVQKMSCLNYDYQRYELNQEVKMKLADSKSVDLMRDFKEQPGQAAGASRDSSTLKRTSKDEDSAFVSLAKLKERLLQRSMRESTLLYRKVMRIDKGRKNVMISALREENQIQDNATDATAGMKAQGKGEKDKAPKRDSAATKALSQTKYLIKLVLFENKRSHRSSHGQVGAAAATDRSRGAAQGQVQQVLRQVSPSTGIPGRSAAEPAEGVDGALHSAIRKEQAPANAQQSSEYVFVFKYEELFTQAELAENDLEDLRTLKRLVAMAMNKRLRVREIPDLLELEQRAPAGNSFFSRREGGEVVPAVAVDNDQTPTRYIAFFLGDKQIDALPKNPSMQKVDLLEGSKEFDMRQLHSFALLSAGKKVLPNKKRDTEDASAFKQNLIYQFEKDDLLFEVFEVLNPRELAFRLKVYQRGTFKMLTICEVGESELRAELVKDKRSFLSGPQQREELAKYLIANSYYDDEAQTLHFMISDLVEDI